jgi:plastocyanin
MRGRLGPLGHAMAKRPNAGVAAAIAIGLVVAVAGKAGAQTEQPSYTPTNSSGQVVVTLDKRIFNPSEIHVPAGKRTQLLVKNLDDTAEEFDSTALKVEKVIAAKSEGVVRLPALDPGRYPFIGEYHADTAKGVVIAE